jgi:hypothetical protein
MTILQTLITKKGPSASKDVSEVIETQKEIEGNSHAREELSDKERSYRNILGLKCRGSIHADILERNYNERSEHYSESKLEQMSPSKRRIALDKKQRLEQAYQFLNDIVNKGT